MNTDIMQRFGLKNPKSFGPDVFALNRVPYSSYIAELGCGEHELRIPINKPVGDELIGSVIDLETTGFSHESDEIIELGAIKFTYSPSAGTITQIESSLNYLQQPTEPLKPIITEVTGLTDDELEGEYIPKERVNSFFSGVSLLIAHNANFDAKFFVKAFGQPKGAIWACSSKGGDIDWKGFGMASSGLEYLNWQLGFFYDAHRASVDCMATLWLLIAKPDALAQLHQSISTPRFLIKAWNCPFDSKDKLKERGFKWNAGETVWQKEVTGNDTLNELKRTLGSIYAGGTELSEVIPVDFTQRFL